MIGVDARGQRGVGQPRRHAANVPPRSIILAHQHTRARVDRASTVHADEAPAWNALHARFDTRRINHSVEYANDEACTNQAESYFPRLRRGEMGHHYRISGVYLPKYAREASWREDHRRDSNGLQVRTVLVLVTRTGSSVDFCGYWQRSRSAA